MNSMNFLKFPRTAFLQNTSGRLLLNEGGSWTSALSSGCKTDRVDFINRMSFLPSNLIEEISPNTEALIANT